MLKIMTIALLALVSGALSFTLGGLLAVVVNLPEQAVIGGTLASVAASVLIHSGYWMVRLAWHWSGSR